MSERVIVLEHPLSGVVFAALNEGRRHREAVAEMMARAARALVNADPQMTLSEAFFLVNRLWVE